MIEKLVIAVSLFNPNRYSILDLPESVLKNSLLISFCVNNEWYHSNPDVVEKSLSCKKHIRFEIEDIEEDLTSKDMEQLKKICENENQIVVACSAGVSRSGAVVEYLKSIGYKLNENYNTKFIPNQKMLDLLLL